MSELQKDFVQVLKTELVRRSQKNPRYSLRSFAKFLEIDSSALSKILNRKRPLGQRSIRRFAERIGLAQEEVATFLPSDLAINNSDIGPCLLEQQVLLLNSLPKSEEDFLWELLPLARQLYGQLKTQMQDLKQDSSLKIQLSVYSDVVATSDEKQLLRQ